MKWNRIFVLSLVAAFAFVGCKEESPVEEKKNITEQSPEVDKTYRPFLHLFTSIHCGGCGRFGIPVSENVAEQMGDSIFMLPTHFKYNDVFINNSSTAIEKALVVTYHSPQLWVNQKEHTYDILNFSHEKAGEYLKTELRKELGNNPGAYIGLEYSLKSNGRMAVAVAVENANDTEAEYYYEVYGMEDGLNEVQAGNTPYRRDHYRVNRGGFYGGMGKQHFFKANEKVTDAFEYIPCLGCTPENLYFAVVVWKSVGNGRFEYVNAKYFR